MIVKLSISQVDRIMGVNHHAQSYNILIVSFFLQTICLLLTQNSHEGTGKVSCILSVFVNQSLTISYWGKNMIELR
jgi:hypothetical protein